MGTNEKNIMKKKLLKPERTASCWERIITVFPLDSVIYFLSLKPKKATILLK